MTIAVIIVNYETVKMTVATAKACLTSSAVTEIVCVDNASIEPSTRTLLEALVDQDPRVQVVHNPANTGFSRAVNLALGRLGSPSPTYVLLLNPDALLEAAQLAELAQYLDEHPDCGAVGPRVVTEGVRVQSAGFLPTPWRRLCQGLQLYRLYPPLRVFKGVNLRLADSRASCEVEWISGACLLLRMSVLEQVGGLDERWFLYAEDQELCRRIGRAGYRLTLLNSVGARHLLSAAAGRDRSTSTMWLDAERDFYRVRVPGRARALAFDMSLAVGFLLRAVVEGGRACLAPSRRREAIGQCRRAFTFARASIRRIDPSVYNSTRDSLGP